MRRQTTVRLGGSRKVKLSREHMYALRQDLDSILGVPNTAELCYCSCHDGHGGTHATPCCQPCPHCHRNVLPEAYAAHTARHETES